MKFDVVKITEEIISFIRKYYEENKLKGAVIGISGGKDSAVVVGLFVRALGRENVVGIWMPCHSKTSDKEDALLVSKYFHIDLKEFDLTDMYDNYVKQIKENNNINDNCLIDANINIKPRLRMLTLYYYAAMLSSLKNGTYLVPGTSNKCELYVGYFTKGGDNVSDINVLADLTVEEVIKIGEYLGIPDNVIHKTPDDGLSGMSDEDKLGVKYSEITSVIKDINNVSEDKKIRIDNLHKRNQHKFSIPTYRRDI